MQRHKMQFHKIQFAKATITAIFSAAILAIVYGGYHWWQQNRFIETTDNAYLQADITTISAKLAGYVSQSLVTDNQAVAAGDVIAILDDQEFRVRLEEAGASLKRSEAALQHLIARRALQMSRIVEAQAATAQQTAELERIQQQLLRTQTLLARNYTSQDDLDSYLLAEKSALAELDNAKARLAAEEQQLNVLSAEQGELRAQLQQQQAAVKLAQIDLDNTRIRAPVDGIIGRRTLQQGMYVKPGQPLVSIVQSDTLWVDANFKETQLENMQPGQTATLKVDAYPSQRIPATILSISPATGAQFCLLPPQNATGNFTKVVQRIAVKLSVPSGSDRFDRLVPGMSVYVSVDTRRDN